MSKWASHVAPWQRMHLPIQRWRFDPWAGKIPCRRKWQPTPVFLPGKSHGHRSLAGYSPWGHKVSDTTELLRTLTLTHTHTHTHSHTHSHTHTHTDSRLGSKLKRNADRSLVSKTDWLGCFRLNFPLAKEKTKQTNKKKKPGTNHKEHLLAGPGAFPRQERIFGSKLRKEKETKTGGFITCS